MIGYLKPPAFTTQDQADAWLDRTELFNDAMHGARQLWLAEDQTIIGYNTKSIPRGGFCSFRYRPDENGMPVEILFIKHHARRAVARQRAALLYRKYAPKWAARHKDFE